jgi:murein DD-endopeptidase MepM/ murein hydrolase activator NlpD
MAAAMVSYLVPGLAANRGLSREPGRSVTGVHTPLAVRMGVISRKVKAGWLATVSVAATIMLAAVVVAVGLSGSAGAAPPLTPARAQKLLVRLNEEATKLGQQYAEVVQQLVSANQWLRVIGKQTAVYRATANAMRRQVAKLAVAAYEQGGMDSPLALFLTASPQRLLGEASILNEMSATDAVQIRQYLNAARGLLSAERTALRTRERILRLKHALGKQLAVLISLNRKEGSLLPVLTLEQLATSGHPYLNPLRETSGLYPERADMGVDFSGSGPVYAIGAGVVTEAMGDNGGWPGGGWITYQLTDGPAVGEVVYLAEDVTPTVQVGQKITPQTVIGNMYNGSDGIETGWAMLDSASSESELPEAGGINGAGPFPTAIGMNFDYLLQALGVPPANNVGEPTSGLVPSRYQIDWAKALR